MDNTTKMPEEILSDLKVSFLELVGDEFAPKVEVGSTERKKLLGLIATSIPIFAEALTALNEWVESEKLEARIDELSTVKQDYPGISAITVRGNIAWKVSARIKKLQEQRLRKLQSLTPSKLKENET